MRTRPTPPDDRHPKCEAPRADRVRLRPRSARLVLLSLALLLTGLTCPALGSPEPVTLSAQDLDIREVLNMLSRSRGLNIVSSGEVTGPVSIQLNRVPFEDALDAVVAIAGYEVTRRGDIYYVRRPPGGDPSAAILRQVRTFRLGHTSPEQLMPAIESLLSPIGRVTPYPPLRALVVEDRPEALARIGAVVAELDVAPRQVLIEARILEVRLARDCRFGIDWSLLFKNGAGEGSLDLEGMAAKAGSGSQGFFLSWGEGDFTAAIENLAGVDELRTLAAPQVVAVDGTEAEIMIGGQLGFLVVTTVENTILQSVEFLDTGAQLRLTPQISGDGFVRMVIHPEISNGAVENGLPSKTTTEVTSDVLIEDGQTLFIGGLIQEREESSRTGIPLLVDIPVLGALFGRTTKNVQRSELVTLITPHILEPGEPAEAHTLGLIEHEALPAAAR